MPGVEVEGDSGGRGGGGGGEVDVRSLEASLRREVAGAVYFDDGSRALYAADASNYRQVPIAVVEPRDEADVAATVAACRTHGAPLLPRGAGTSLAGQCCNVAVILDFTRHMNRVLEIDADHRLARVQPGTVLDVARDAAAAHGLTFGPDPSTHAWCTVGGMLGNNSCGVHSLMAGRTSDNTHRLRVVTCDGLTMELEKLDPAAFAQRARQPGREGEIHKGLGELAARYGALIEERYPKIPRRVSGYNLDELLHADGPHLARALVGSEGTCATIVEATLNLVPSPAHRTLAVLGYPDVPAAADAVPRLLELGPIGLEGMDAYVVENMRAKGLEIAGLTLLPPAGAWLFVEFGSDAADEAVASARRAIEQSRVPARLLETHAEAQPIWHAREAGLGASARLADGTETWEGWEDAAVHPDRLGDYMRDFQKLYEKFGYRTVLYGHFGQGLVHTRMDFDLASDDGIKRYRAFVEEAADLVVHHGGSISGEHGDGQARAELLTRMFGPELVEAFSQFKALWDPQDRMNPGKVVRPNRLDDHLRPRDDHPLPQIETRFAYPNDDGNFARATSRCIGVGKCRRTEGGIMCPSYMATRDERHSTRGRAHLLHEMAHGRLPDGWRNESVKDSLDLCLSCKGCKLDCPAGVDVATYKAEFLSHYYEGRRRPRQAYAFGLVHQWARLASATPRLVNALTALPGVEALAKRVAGVARERRLPRFASTTFQRQMRGREAGEGENEGRRPRVVLWPDTFNNHFTPASLEAGLRVLEGAGFEVVVPTGPVCCGRPLYDFGMLDRARAVLRRTLATLSEHIDAGTPVVALEPSCLAVFRDELVNLLPDDARALALSQRSFTLAEFLTQRVEGYEPPRLTGRALFHGHCHQKALAGVSADVALLRQAGLEVTEPEVGCCGMAGSFGFHQEHVDVSRKIGERALLPAVRAAAGETLLVADGFSCREQIAQMGGRATVHLAEVLAQQRAAAV
ncbi:MAG: FAD-binding and (Fe-S)-binding domain-containing protein [Phycisphaeraceae bacterium]